METFCKILIWGGFIGSVICLWKIITLTFQP